MWFIIIPLPLLLLILVYFGTVAAATIFVIRFWHMLIAIGVSCFLIKLIVLSACLLLGLESIVGYEPEIISLGRKIWLVIVILFSITGLGFVGIMVWPQADSKPHQLPKSRNTVKVETERFRRAWNGK